MEYSRENSWLAEGQCLFLLNRRGQARKDWVLAKALSVREWKEAGKRKHQGRGEPILEPRFPYLCKVGKEFCPPQLALRTE